MQITKEKEGDIQIIRIEGRIDTVTSPELEKAVMGGFKEGSHILLDFKKVEYISSAGLRALLLGHKTAASKGGEMLLENVPEIVKEVFDMTGFSSIFKLKKAE